MAVVEPIVLFTRLARTAHCLNAYKERTMTKNKIIETRKENKNKKIAV